MSAGIVKSEMNVPFLLKEHGDPQFLFHNFDGNNILNNWEKYTHKSMATFSANEIKVNKYCRERHNGPNNGLSKMCFL